MGNLVLKIPWKNIYISYFRFPTALCFFQYVSLSREVTEVKKYVKQMELNSLSAFTKH